MGDENHTLTGDWTSATVTQSGLSGSSFVLRVTMKNSAQSEDIRLDNVELTGENNPVVQFTVGDGSVSEAEGSTALAVEIRNPPSGNEVTADVAFNSSSSSAGTGDIGNYSTQTVSFSSGVSDGATETVSVSITSDATQEGGEIAAFDIENVSGGGASAGSPTQFDLTIKDAVSDHSDEVLISEVMPDPDAVSDGDGEYIELYNTTTNEIDLDANGWTLNVDGDTDGIPATIPPRGFLMLCENPTASENGGIKNCDVDYVNGISLKNNGSTIELLDGSDIQVDSVNYGGSNFPNVPTGKSLVFTGTTANNDGNNWAAATRRERGYAQDQSGDDGSPGRNGTGQTLQPTAEVTGGAGWRMLSAPIGGVNADPLAQVSLVQGVPGHFPGAAANLYQWPGGPDDQNTDWETPSSATGDLTGSGAPSGAAGGFLWYIFDTAETEFTDTPPFTLSVPGAPRTSDATTDALSGTSSGNNAFHLLGNPYAQSFDLSALNLSNQGFQTTVQVWDPSAGSYEPVLQSSTSDDFIGPYQGFFVERGSSGSATLTFSASGRRADPIDLKTMEEAPPRIEFRLVGRDGDGVALTRDEALVLHAPDGATPGWDPHDATKLTPLSGRYATAAFRDTLDGKTRLQAVASIPQALPEEGIELPVSLQLQGTDPVETLRLRWPTWKNVPESWGISLHDAVADSTVNLRTRSSYAFSLPPSKAQSVAPPRSPLAAPSSIRAKAGSGSARFTLAVQPNPLPVELSGFDATVSGETARLAWATAGETNNAGFHVEHRGPEAERFASAGFVEGHGTTDAPQQYRFRTDPLDPGRHVFRLRQVDLDGTATRSDTVAVQVRLAEAAEMAVAPNPVRTRATVSLRVRAEQAVTVTLYDVLGRRVRTVHDGPMAPGRDHAFQVDASGLSSGLYLLRADGEQFQRTHRITVVR
ncbi:MAG: hypothetical protein BRD28_00370 [Bacteroidetes bacterium QH_10_64_37]|nr:MAG: hypothetical protein BRD28_00370 [Bacteroidetes bacterium QH_10_64_37]